MDLCVGSDVQCDLNPTQRTLASAKQALVGLSNGLGNGQAEAAAAGMAAASCVGPVQGFK
jgi:hypothetical protein